jgi:hypothetical protein
VHRELGWARLAPAGVGWFDRYARHACVHAIFAAVPACLLAKFEFRFKLEVESELVELGVRPEYLPYPTLLST